MSTLLRLIFTVLWPVIRRVHRFMAYITPADTPIRSGQHQPPALDTTKQDKIIRPPEQKYTAHRAYRSPLAPYPPHGTTRAIWTRGQANNARVVCASNSSIPFLVFALPVETQIRVHTADSYPPSPLLYIIYRLGWRRLATAL